MHAESAAFATDLANKEAHSRRASYVRIGLGTLAILFSYLLVVWAIARRQSARVRALKEQAEQIRDADFGEPLVETRDDELGELASVFNDMRDRLRNTTISRDYVDSILSGMNEAIMVTELRWTYQTDQPSHNDIVGSRARVKLLGTSIENIVNKEKTASLDLEGASDDSARGIFR